MRKKVVKRVVIGVLIGVASLGLFRLFFPILVRAMMCEHFVKEGISNYSNADSSMSICKYLTVRVSDGNSQDTDVRFLNRYSWEDAFYHYESDYTFTSQKEVVALALRYDPSTYNEASADIFSQPGLSSEIRFEYGEFDFYLNDTERINEQRPFLTDFNLSGDEPCIRWINLIAFSAFRGQIVSLGFCYGEFDFFGRLTEKYPFSGWDDFIEENYSFFDWGKAK